jgi:hypothetical protein
METTIFTIFALIAAITIAALWMMLVNHRRSEFIRGYEWPPGLLAKLESQHFGFTRKESALVGSGLRQFFLAYLKSGKQFVSMPSQAADDLWHEFILYTREYRNFCQNAFGGFLHHTPAVVLSPNRKQDNAGLRRVWWHTCKLENIDPAKPSRLPLLFALDAKLNIPGGFVYHPNCEALRPGGGGSGGHCGGDFSSNSIDGSTDGFGDGGGGGDGEGGGGCGGGD